MSDWTDNGDGTHSYRDDFYSAEITPVFSGGWRIAGRLHNAEDDEQEHFLMQDLDSLDQAKAAVETLFGAFRKIRRGL